MQRGFTLLEVLVSLALLGVFVLIILQGIGQAVMLKTDEANIVTATQLAQAKMVELEIDIQEDGFSEFENEECGEFREGFDDYTEQFEGFTWCYTVKKVELSIPQEMLQGLAGDAAEDASSGGQDYVSGEGGGTGDLLSALGIDMETVTEQLSEGIRMLEVKVKWGQEGKDEQDVTLTTHLVRMSEVEGLPQ